MAPDRGITRMRVRIDAALSWPAGHTPDPADPEGEGDVAGAAVWPLCGHQVWWHDATCTGAPPPHPDAIDQVRAWADNGPHGFRVVAEGAEPIPLELWRSAALDGDDGSVIWTAWGPSGQTLPDGWAVVCEALPADHAVVVLVDRDDQGDTPVIRFAEHVEYTRKIEPRTQTNSVTVSLTDPDGRTVKTVSSRMRMHHPRGSAETWGRLRDELDAVRERHPAGAEPS